MKVLIVVSDGYPQDCDYGPDRNDDEYGIQDTAAALREAALRGLAQYDDARIGPVLVEAYSSFSDSQHRAAIATLAARASGATALLTAIGEGRIPASDLTADLARQMELMGDDQVNALLLKNWGQVRESGADKTAAMDEMKQLYDETLAYKRRLDLAIVLYTHQLHPSIQPVMKYVDVVSLWIWTGADIQMIEENFKKYRSLVPDKPTLLGIYMWDFGGRKELDQNFMVKQLDYALRLYKERQIEGMIFHCTPLVNKNLLAVEYAKEWIAKHGNEKR